jgi:hypothetical protein
VTPWEWGFALFLAFSAGYVTCLFVRGPSEVEEAEWRLDYLHRWVHKQLRLPPPEEDDETKKSPR